MIRSYGNRYTKGRSGLSGLCSFERLILGKVFLGLILLSCVLWRLAPSLVNRDDDSSSRDRLQAGLDPSEALLVVDHGGIFRRLDGTDVGPIEIARDYGYKWIRIRIMVDPSGTYGLTQDLDQTIRMAREIKRLGLQFLLDFHYSHWWADDKNQWTPLYWRPSRDNSGEEQQDPDMDTLKKHVYDHTYRTMEVLHEEGALPDAVQVGNEISAGMLWGHGKLPRTWKIDESMSKEWPKLVELTQAGVSAINDVAALAKKDRPKIVIHLDTGGDAEFTEQWMTTYLQLGGTCDIIGLSWYPMWHGTMKQLKHNIDNLSIKFPKQDVWVVETAYYHNGYCSPDDEECNEMFPYPQTEQGQFDFLADLRKTLLTTKCNAVFYWGSHWTQPELWFHADEDWADAGRRSLFDKNGRALAGIRALPGLP